MIVSLKSWLGFISKLSQLDDKAARLITDYMSEHNISDDEGKKALLDYAYAVATKYGEASGSLACQIYDMVAEAQHANVPPAVPAPTPTYPEVARTVNGASMFSQNPDYIGGAVGSLVKRTGVDTTLNNALRDGAEWAWIPHGDTCPFCLMLASNGWQRASKKALRKGHASHIHANCDCTYAIRFDGVSTVEGYDPDALYEQYKNAEGRTGTDKVNYLRRQKYAANKDVINAQKRVTYAQKNEREMFRKINRMKAEDGHSIIDDRTYKALTKNFIKNGGTIIRGEMAAKHLEGKGYAAYLPGLNTAIIRDDSTVSDVIEEMRHAYQDQVHMFGYSTVDEEVFLKREIEAQKYLLKVKKRYKIPLEETELTKANLAYYEMKLKKLLAEREDDGH